MPFFEPIQYLYFVFSAIILFAYLKNYNTALLYSTNKENYVYIVCFAILAVGYTIGLQLVLQLIGLQENLFNIAFFYSAFVEEFVKCCVLLFVLWINKITDSLYDGIFYGILLGGIFGFIENILYLNSLSFWTMMLRTITSSPLHLLNGGIIGYFSMKFLFTKQSYKYKYLVQGFFICFISHAVYNSAGYLGGMYLVVLPLILVSNFIIVEILSALARSTLPKYTLDLIDLSIFEYKLIRRYTKYELWLYNEQKTEKSFINLFKSVKLRKKILSSIVLSISVGFIIFYIFFPDVQKLFFTEILLQEYISIFIVYPLIISVTIFFAGLLNPEFFHRQVLQVPLISFLDISNDDYSETAVIFYLTLYGFYVSLINPEKFEGKLELNFTIAQKEFNKIKGHVIWINEYKGEIGSARSHFSVSGAFILFDGYPMKLILYWNWVRWSTRFINLLKSLTGKL
ncbi:MAG: PrsW family intramembrane metalloprotease [Leptospiraceae bacterium]|nr:PrsW family intramembrane metalloprotease [Leptospiraceae bacterium]